MIANRKIEQAGGGRRVSVQVVGLGNPDRGDDGVGLLVAVCSTIIGAAMGAMSGWFQGGVVDEVILWIKGVLDSIPF